MQETNLVHTVLCKDSWACCDSIISRIRGNMGRGTVLSQYAKTKNISLLFTPRPQTKVSTQQSALLSECLSTLVQAPVNYIA